MKKFTLAAITAAVAMGWTGTALAEVNLNDPNSTTNGSVPYAVELVTNNLTTLSGVTTSNLLGFGVSANQTRFVRYDLTNSSFAAVQAPANLVLAPLANNTVVSQGGAVGGTFVIFQVTADAVGNEQGSAVKFNPGVLKVTDKSAPASFKYTLYESAADASAGGALGLLATATAAVATFPSGLVFTATPNTTQAEVTTLYTEFNNGIGAVPPATVTLAKIGTVTYAPNTAVHNPAAPGAALVVGDMPLFTAAGTKLVLTGIDLTAAAVGGLYLSAAANCAGATFTDLLPTATVANFVIGAAPISGQSVCFQATGTTAIAAQNFTVAATVVPAALASTTDQAAIAAGNFTRNGTILKAAFADTTTASGVSMAVHLTNTGAIPAPYTVRCLLNSGSVAGTAGTVPAATAVRQSVTAAGGMGCPANGTMRGIELTFAVPEGNVIGAMVRQNTSTGAASFDSMIGSK